MGVFVRGGKNVPLSLIFQRAREKLEVKAQIYKISDDLYFAVPLGQNPLDDPLFPLAVASRRLLEKGEVKGNFSVVLYHDGEYHLVFYDEERKSLTYLRLPEDSEDVKNILYPEELTLFLIGEETAERVERLLGELPPELAGRVNIITVRNLEEELGNIIKDITPIERLGEVFSKVKEGLSLFPVKKALTAGILTLGGVAGWHLLNTYGLKRENPAPVPPPPTVEKRVPKPAPPPPQIVREKGEKGNPEVEGRENKSYAFTVPLGLDGALAFVVRGGEVRALFKGKCPEDWEKVRENPVSGISLCSYRLKPASVQDFKLKLPLTSKELPEYLPDGVEGVKRGSKWLITEGRGGRW